MGLFQLGLIGAGTLFQTDRGQGLDLFVGPFVEQELIGDAALTRVDLLHPVHQRGESLGLSQRDAPISRPKASGWVRMA